MCIYIYIHVCPFFPHAKAFEPIGIIHQIVDPKPAVKGVVPFFRDVPVSILPPACLGIHRPWAARSNCAPAAALRKRSNCLLKIVFWNCLLLVPLYSSWKRSLCFCPPPGAFPNNSDIRKHESRETAQPRLSPPCK